MPRYRYFKEGPRGEEFPLVRCPNCGSSLLRRGSVTLVAFVGGRVVDNESRLDDNGYLEDVDRLVENGYHSGTGCGDCGELLIDLDGVVEEDAAVEPFSDSLHREGF